MAWKGMKHGYKMLVGKFEGQASLEISRHG
jgi:hypothetical protein